MYVRSYDYETIESYNFNKFCPKHDSPDSRAIGRLLVDSFADINDMLMDFLRVLVIVGEAIQDSRVNLLYLLFKDYCRMSGFYNCKNGISISARKDIWAQANENERYNLIDVNN